VRIEWVHDFGGTGSGGLFATPEAYDAEPLVPALLIDGCPVSVPAERLAVAAALIFSRHASGVITLPEPVSPEVAHAVEVYVDTWVAVGPIRLQPAALPGGTGMFVMDGPHVALQNGPGRPRQISLDVRRSDRWAGRMVAIDEVVVASNAWLHGDAGDTSDIRSHLGPIAVAALLADSLDVDTINLPLAVDRETRAWQRVQSLLASSRLGLL